MASINKNTDIKDLNKLFKDLGKGDVIITPFLPFKFPLDIPKKGTPLGDFKLQSHWIPLNHNISFPIECKFPLDCPICKMFKPKTRYQKLKIKIKEGISKLWKLWKH